MSERSSQTESPVKHDAIEPVSALRAARGRPIGTGIDDRIWLRELRHLIRLDPATPPTTAIKSLGITDPSTIRRLREKYRRCGLDDGGANGVAGPVESG